MKRTIARLMLISDKVTDFGDRLKYWFSTFIHFAPVAFVLEQIEWWFSENRQFGTFMCIALIVNMVVGAWHHVRNKTFCFKDFFLKNLEMCTVVVIGYIMLEMLRYTAGDNIAGELFRVSIQVMTLLYPTSKVLKNIFIISKGKYPPEFIMKRLYSFERNGDLSKLFETNGDLAKDVIAQKQQEIEDVLEKSTLTPEEIESMKANN